MSSLVITDLHASVITDEGAREILRGVDLTIDSGVTNAIMGPNGSGKSTLAYVIAGHPKYQVTQGSITLDGQDVLAITVVGLAVLGLAACSGGSSSTSSTSGSETASSRPLAASPSDPNAPSPEILALCDQIVVDAMPQADAESLAASKGYTTRIGSVDGEPRAVTMDYRLDRMTFDIENGVVTNCLVG